MAVNIAVRPRGKNTLVPVEQWRVIFVDQGAEPIRQVWEAVQEFNGTRQNRNAKGWEAGKILVCPALFGALASACEGAVNPKLGIDVGRGVIVKPLDTLSPGVVQVCGRAKTAPVKAKRGKSKRQEAGVQSDGAVRSEPGAEPDGTPVLKAAGRKRKPRAKKETSA